MNIGIIGCGAITESFYLPAFSKIDGTLKKTTLVDLNEKRLAQLSNEYSVAGIETNYKNILDKIEVAVVAVPHGLHYKIVKELLENKINVLCEKPLTLVAEEAAELIEISKSNDLLLAVNNTRRVFPSYKNVKELIDSGVIGKISEVNYYEGGEFSWPTESGFYFNSSDTPRGVLLDRGAHVLDAICNWVDGKPDVVSSLNDSYGGCEALSKVKFRYKDIEGEVVLSWFYKQSNTYEIKGERGKISGDIYDWRNVKLHTDQDKEKIIKVGQDINVFSDLGDILIANFFEALEKNDGDRLIVQGKDVIDSIKFLEECYEKAERFNLEWNKF